jgi:hypothetical protein
MSTHALANILKKFDNQNKIFVESGTYQGEGVQEALFTHKYKSIESIEIEPNLYNHCKQKFIQYPNVHIHFGDSGVVLKNIIDKYEQYDDGITFWLDGHASGGITGCAKDYLSPIVNELKIIASSKNKNKHIIIIDDMDDFTEAKINLNRINNSHVAPGYIPQTQLHKILKLINPNFHIYYSDNGNQLIATPYETN